MLIFITTVNAQEAPAFVKKVYEDMYSAMSNGNVVKPKLKISDDIKEVATYFPPTNEIIVGTEFIKLCRTFGKDSMNAMAHVLGHELAHLLLQQNDFVKTIGSGYASTEFNNQIKKIHKTLKDTLFERQADEYATFFAHASGYNTVKVGENVLDSIYKHFKLTDKELSKYPSLKERKAICSASAKKMNVLKSLFDYANLATVSGNYDFAISCYNTIIKEKFPSREIYNNLSVVYLLKAIKEIDTIDFPYFFPIEIDFKSRLYSNERSIFSEFEENLIEAIRLSESALGNKKDYSKAWLNKAIAEFLLERKVDGQYSLHKAEENADNLSKNDIEIMKALFEHKFGVKQLALFSLSFLAKTDALAEQNYLKLSCKDTTEETVFISSGFFDILDKIKIPKFDFTSAEAKKSDTLKKTLIFVDNMHISTLANTDFIGTEGRDNTGDKKPSFTLFKLVKLPEFNFEKEKMNALVKFSKSENETYFIYKNWIIECEKELLKNCYLIKK